jgi:hypothetical protein
MRGLGMEPIIFPNPVNSACSADVVLLEGEHDDDGTLVTYRVEESQERAMEYRDNYYMACESMKVDMAYRLELYGSWWEFLFRRLCSPQND